MFGNEVSFIPKHGQVQLCAWREKGRREEGGQEGAARDVESCVCVPARAVLRATEAHGHGQSDTVSSAGASPAFGAACFSECESRVKRHAFCVPKC